MKFHYTLERSTAKEDQATGVRCSRYWSTGTIDANSVRQVEELVQLLMIIPGVYSMNIKNAGPDCEWLPAKSFDTRMKVTPGTEPKVKPRKSKPCRS